jgi:hypothetical protein
MPQTFGEIEALESLLIDPQPHITILKNKELILLRSLLKKE